MSDTKMLQAILDKISSVDRKVDTVKKELKEELKNTENRLTKRIDKVGLQVARLEDDAPTNEEFDALEKRVTKLEHSAGKN